MSQIKEQATRQSTVPFSGATAAKIFCVGFQKTGTSSMGAALQSLGYSMIGARGSMDPDIAKTAYDMVDQYLPLYDAFQDNPWAVLFEYIDSHFPGNKFILTVRDPDAWLKSAVRYFGHSTTPMREWIYGEGVGDPIGNEQQWLERYLRHNESVRAYFKGREGTDFLELGLGDGDEWDQLCPFLGVPVVVDRPFPHRNSDRENRRFSTRARRTLKKLRRRVIGNEGNLP